MFEEPVDARLPDPFAAVLGDDPMKRFTDRAAAIAERLEGRTVWHVNSTARGGGVAEMLASLLAYDTGLGIVNRWLVIDTDEAFLDVTKKIHNRLHGAPDEGAFEPKEKEAYEARLEQEAAALKDFVSERDVVLLHDPQVAGLVAPAKELGATVLWRLHIGADEIDDVVRDAQEFLRPFIEGADGFIFSRKAHVWDGLPEDRVAIIPPCIDAFSPKNQDLTDEQVAAILGTAGIASGPTPDAEPTDPEVTLEARRRHGEPLDPDAVVVAQIGRWDRLKDPIGVINGFAEHIAPNTDAHLLLAGPLADAVDDDPDGSEVMKEVLAAVDALSADVKDRIHIENLPAHDIDQSAFMVNAIQRRADVMVQKSLAEGFGLTVAEAMWKSRPMVASGVGGIQDQIEHGETGLLIDDPEDLAAFGGAVTQLLSNRERAQEMGEKARGSVRDRFLVPSHLMTWYEVLESALDRVPAGTA